VGLAGGNVSSWLLAAVARVVQAVIPPLAVPVGLLTAFAAATASNLRPSSAAWRAPRALDALSPTGWLHPRWAAAAP